MKLHIKVNFITCYHPFILAVSFCVCDKFDY